MICFNQFYFSSYAAISSINAFNILYPSQYCKIIFFRERGSISHRCFFIFKLFIFAFQNFWIRTSSHYDNEAVSIITRARENFWSSSWRFKLLESSSFFPEEALFFHPQSIINTGFSHFLLFHSIRVTIIITSK